MLFKSFIYTIYNNLCDGREVIFSLFLFDTTKQSEIRMNKNRNPSCVVGRKQYKTIRQHLRTAKKKDDTDRFKYEWEDYRGGEKPSPSDI